MEHSFFEKVGTKMGEFEFNFLRIYTINGVRLFVTVIDNKLRSHLFYMEKVNRIWTITEKEKVPDWILEAEEMLETAILLKGDNSSTG